jgi:hypothetical protein
MPKYQPKGVNMLQYTARKPPNGGQHAPEYSVRLAQRGQHAPVQGK